MLVCFKMAMFSRVTGDLTVIEFVEYSSPFLAAYRSRTRLKMEFSESFVMSFVSEGGLFINEEYFVRVDRIF